MLDIIKESSMYTCVCLCSSHVSCRYVHMFVRFCPVSRDVCAEACRKEGCYVDSLSGDVDRTITIISFCDVDVYMV